ncbi:MAG: homoserine kinase, partial [bacterium]
MANLACGFDILGMAIEAPGDCVEIRPNDSGKLIIRRITGDQGQLSRDAEKNTVTVAMRAILQALGSNQGYDIV